MQLQKIYRMPMRNVTLFYYNHINFGLLFYNSLAMKGLSSFPFSIGCRFDFMFAVSTKITVISIFCVRSSTHHFLFWSTFWAYEWNYWKTKGNDADTIEEEVVIMLPIICYRRQSENANTLTHIQTLIGILTCDILLHWKWFDPSSYEQMQEWRFH